MYYLDFQDMLKHLDDWYIWLENISITSNFKNRIDTIDKNVFHLFSFIDKVLDDPLRKEFKYFMKEMNEFDDDIKEMCDHFGIEVSELSTLTPEKIDTIVENYAPYASSSENVETFKNFESKFFGFFVGTNNPIYGLQKMQFRTIFSEKRDELYNKFNSEIPKNGERLSKIYEKIDNRYFK